jgi:hypothetical protein
MKPSQTKPESLFIFENNDLIAFARLATECIDMFANKMLHARWILPGEKRERKKASFQSINQVK